MADSSKDIQLRELKDMINDLKKMIKTLQATVDAANKREASRKSGHREVTGFYINNKI